MYARVYTSVGLFACMYARECVCTYVSPHTPARHTDHMSEFSKSSETHAYMRAYMHMHIVTHFGMYHDDLAHKMPKLEFCYFRCEYLSFYGFFELWNLCATSS